MKTVTFSVMKSTTTDDGFGGESQTWTEAVSTRGRLADLPTTRRQIGDKEGVYRTHQLESPRVNVTEADRVKIGARIFLIRGIQCDLNYKGLMKIDLELRE